MTNKLSTLMLVLFLILGSLALLPADEPAGKTQDEYLAFEFFFSGTAQRQYEMLEGQKSPKPFYDTTRALLDYQYDDFSLFVDWSMIDDEIYDPSEVYMLGRYFFINDAHVQYDTERFSVKTGRSTQTDVIDSPYSLFVSSEPIPAVQIETKYKGDYFFYTNRWVRLNNRSEQVYFGTDSGVAPFDDGDFTADYPDGVYWLDRGANFHIYGLNLGDWRFGFQESAVFYNDDFNAEFFFSPMIMYFAQLVVNGGSKPWNEFSNSKHFMGFFLDKTTDQGYFASQILVDDINGDILPGVKNENQNRLAWSVGGYRNYPFGRVGLFHGGATKHTFAPTYTADPGDKDYDSYDPDQVPVYYSTRPYPYTYYPAVQYDTDDGPMPIDYTQNYIGYKYGESNLSFMLDYENVFWPQTPRQLELYSALEWVLNGPKSPVNPWHEYDHWRDIPEATEILGDGPVEHIVSLRTKVARPVRLFGAPFSLFADAEVGMAFNAMGLEPASTETVPVDRAQTEPWIYRPQRGEHEPLFQLTLGMSYRWRLK